MSATVPCLLNFAGRRLGCTDNLGSHPRSRLGAHFLKEPSLRSLRALAVVVGLVAAGCGGPEATAVPATPTQKAVAPPAVHAGECLAKEIPDGDDVAPDLTSAIDCTKPHVYEVSDVLGSTTDGSQLADEFQSYAASECESSILKRAGTNRIKDAGKPLKEVNAGLVMSGGSTWVNLTPAAGWADKQEFICAVRYTEHQTGGGDLAPRPVKAKSDHPAFHDFLTEDFPADRRLCITYDGQERYSLEPCGDGQHYGEIFFGYDAAAAFGEKFVEGVDSEEPSEAEWTKLSDPCFEALPALLGNNFDEDLSGVADLADAGWYEYEDFDLPAGSLVENADRVDFVPVAKGQGA